MISRTITRNRGEKRKLIYDSFSRLVNSIGYEKVTTRKIAEDAGISVGIIYLYFPEGKPAIAAGFWEDSLNTFMDPVKVLYGSKKELEEEIRLHLENHRKYEAIYRGFDEALLERRDLFEGLKKSRAEIIKAKILKHQTDSSQSVNSVEELVEKYMRVYGLVDALVHRHLFQTQYANSDDILISLLMGISSTLLHDNLH